MDEIDLGPTLADRVWRVRSLVDDYVAAHGLGPDIDAADLATRVARACPAGTVPGEAVARAVHRLAVAAYVTAVPEGDAHRLGCDRGTLRRLQDALGRLTVDLDDEWGDPGEHPETTLRRLAVRAGRYAGLDDDDPYRRRHLELERLAGARREMLLRVAARLVPADADDVVHDVLDHCMQRLLCDYLLERTPLVAGAADVRGRVEAYVTVAVRHRAFDVGRRRGRVQVGMPAPARRLVDEHAARDAAAAEARVRLHELGRDLPRLREALRRRLPRNGRHRRIVQRALEATASEWRQAVAANPGTDPTIALAWYAAHRLGEVETDTIGPEHTRGSREYRAAKRAAEELRDFLRDEAGGA